MQRQKTSMRQGFLHFSSHAQILSIPVDSPPFCFFIRPCWKRSCTTVVRAVPTGLFFVTRAVEVLSVRPCFRSVSAAPSPMDASTFLVRGMMPQILGQGAMASPMVALKGPLMNKQDYSANFPLKHAQKDMRFALGLGDKVRCCCPEYVGGGRGGGGRLRGGLFCALLQTNCGRDKSPVSTASSKC